MPLDVLITTLTQLYAARQQCKQVIYEITGISDILRGSSVASETATAQNIKNQWGTLRLKRMQKEVQRYCRDLLRIMLEIAASKFSEETWAKMTGLPYLTTMQVQQLQQMIQALQQQGQQLQMQAQQIQASMPPPPPPMQGQPAPPAPPPNPQLQAMQQQGQQLMQQLQQAQQKLQSTPKWGEVLGLLKDDIQRAYRIDIETNSTVEPEAVEDQKQITELMTALGQYLNGVMPLVAKGTLPFQAAQSMLLAITRRFRFGSEIEDYIKEMQPPKPDDGGKGVQAQVEHAKIQAEQQRAQMELQQKQAEMQAETQEAMAKLQHQQQSEQARNQIELEKIQAQRETEAMRIEGEKQAQLATLNAERATEKMKAQMEQETELKKAALTAATQIEIANIKATADANAVMQASAAEGEQTANTADMMAKILATQERLLIAIAAPKKIERDEQGRALHLVPQV